MATNNRPHRSEAATDNETTNHAKIFYADLWGLREDKYRYLFDNDAKSTEWQELTPIRPYYFFIPKDLSLQSEYDKFFKVTDIFKEYSSGVETGKDKRLVGFSPREIEKIFIDIFNPKMTLDDLRLDYGLRETSGWKIGARRQQMFKKGQRFSRENFVPYAYRPFDTRFTYYCDFLRRPHPELTKHLGEENVCLLCMREVVIEAGFSHIFVTNLISDRRMFLSNRGAPYFFPLHLYPEAEEKDLIESSPVASPLSPQRPGRLSASGGWRRKRISNFTDKFLKAMKESVGKTTTADQIFAYIYAVLYSPTYRSRYEELLKIDFPRIPLPPNPEAFKNLAALGQKLIDLHLLKSPELEESAVHFPESGSDIVERVKYDEAAESVYINKKQHFAGISPEVWQYRIGAYQVLEKYLKDRRKRKLSLDEINHYKKMAKAIEMTGAVQGEVDEVYEQAGFSGDDAGGIWRL
jgi:predicted helicase